MAESFISYIREDEIVAKALQVFLEAKLVGTRVFAAGDQLELGDNWLRKIRSALRSARVILALFSHQAVKRPWVNFEAGGAWFSDEKKLIPLCIGSLDPSKLPKPYSVIQGARLDGPLEDLWFLVNDLWRIPGVGSIKVPKQFDENDAVAKTFAYEVDRWGNVRRARAAYKRRTGEDASE